MTLHKAGGIAALVDAATYVFGFALLATVLAPTGYGTDTSDPDAIAALIVDNRAVIVVWNLAIYVVNAIALVVLTVALADRFRPHAPGLSQLAFAFGLLWATLVLAAGMLANVSLDAVAAAYDSDPDAAGRLWHIFHTVEIGIGGGNEIAGGVWAIVLGIAGLHTRVFSRWLSVLALAIGVAGLVSVLPGLSEIGGAIFGLGFIAWFVWVGVVLLRFPAPAVGGGRTGMSHGWGA